MAWKRGTLRSSKRARRDAFARRGLQHLDAVLVGAGQEIDVVAVEPLKARDRVGRDRLIGVTDVRNAVGIGDRGGEVIAGLLGHDSLFLSSFRLEDASTGITKKAGDQPGHDDSASRYQPRSASAR